MRLRRTKRRAIDDSQKKNKKKKKQETEGSNANEITAFARFFFRETTRKTHAAPLSAEIYMPNEANNGLSTGKHRRPDAWAFQSDVRTLNASPSLPRALLGARSDANSSAISIETTGRRGREISPILTQASERKKRYYRWTRG